jgi:hypothetical protein
MASASLVNLARNLVSRCDSDGVESRVIGVRYRAAKIDLLRTAFFGRTK